jgi:phage tail sheath protein FI
MSDESPRAPGVTVRETAAPAPEPGDAVPPESPVDGVNDYRYIQIRRTITYIKVSIKNALDQFVFEPNTQATWSQAVSAVTGVLQEAWARGELAGATPEQAFSVQCGVGSTMTAQDVRDGNLAVQVTLRGLDATPTVLKVEVKLRAGV